MAHQCRHSGGRIEAGQRSLRDLVWEKLIFA